MTALLYGSNLKEEDMKRGQIFEGIVEKIKFPNKGILHIEDHLVEVKNALPGQKIRFVIKKKNSGKAEGRLLEILETSPLEYQENPCKHAGICGGCLYQTIPYEEQLKIKEEQVKGLLDGVCKNSISSNYIWEGIKASPRVNGYRNKMEFSFGDAVKGGELELGMHKRGSFHDIVTVEDCRIIDEDYRKILACALGFAKEQGWDYYHKMQHTGALRHLLVRKAVKTGEIMVDLVTTSDSLVNLEGFAPALLALELDGKITGVLHTINDSLADVVQSDRTDILYGRDYFYEELLGLRFRITPFSFFQTNSLGAEVLYDTARSYIGDTKDQVLYDLYSGTGTIAQLMAPVAKEVVGVEIVEEAVEAAKENAVMNGLDNCKFLAGDVLKVLDDIEEKPDFIILDPPRDGVHPKALQKILSYGVERMIYISCKPTSLVRDLEAFHEAGYRVVKACSVDMFPATANVETIAILTR